MVLVFTWPVELLGAWATRGQLSALLLAVHLVDVALFVEWQCELPES